MRVFTGKSIRKKYSEDKSIYKIIPKGVIFPKNEADVIDIVAYARKEHQGITARGGGTGLSGAALGHGIIVDFTKYFTKVLHVGSVAKVQSGVLLKKLRPILLRKKLLLSGVPLHPYCAIGSHMENLQRKQGFKGFNQDSVTVIIKETDPRTQKHKEHKWAA
jgi:glycolate oxidase